MKKRNLKLLVIAAVAAAPLTGPFSGARAEAATIRADSKVYIRNAGSASAEKIGAAESGQTVQLMGGGDGWYQIEYQGSIGYASQAYWTANTVTSLAKVNVRQAAFYLAPIIDVVNSGTEVLVLGRSEEWLYIEHDGKKGFSKKTFWDIPEALFATLPYVIGDPLILAEAALSQDEPDVSSESAGDRYHVISEISGYSGAAKAKAKRDAISRVPSGTYFIYKIIDGMYNLSEQPEQAGFWIDPSENSGLKKKSEPVITEGEMITEPFVPAQEASPGSGEAYTIRASLPGHATAAAAAAGGEPDVTVPAGEYYIFKAAKGMYNVSATPSEPGAWIDPKKNQAPQAPPAALPAAPAQEASASPLGDRIVAEAMKLIGAPYVFGAETWEEGGFDCSGVTQFAYGQLGIAIPRRASQQWAGIARKVTEPRPGDIIAFEKEGRIYHVGIYAGDNQMIHAPKPGAQVKLSDLSWWYKNSTVKGFLRPYSD